MHNTFCHSKNFARQYAQRNCHREVQHLNASRNESLKDLVVLHFLWFFYLVHFTGQDLLPRGKGHNRTPRSLTRCPTSHLTQPPFTYERQPQHRDHPTLIRIVRGFFNVPQNYQHSRNCETGPPVYRPYPRRPESLTICR